MAVSTKAFFSAICFSSRSEKPWLLSLTVSSSPSSSAGSKESASSNPRDVFSSLFLALHRATSSGDKGDVSGKLSSGRSPGRPISYQNQEKIKEMEWKKIEEMVQ